MIKNERQYRITKSQAEKFADAIRRVEKAPSSANPLVVKASREALESQLADLHSEIEEYERLLTGDVHLVEVESFQELPAALIRARIAAGLSQRDLGERLDMKEQQIQRYEATDFAGASFSTLSAIVNALGVSMREDILVPTEHLTVNKFLTRLEGFGLDKTFVQKRLFPRDAASPPSAGQQTGELLFKTAANLKRVYGWSLGESVGTAIPKFDVATAGAARFKIPARVADQRRTPSTPITSRHWHFKSRRILRASRFPASLLRSQQRSRTSTGNSAFPPRSITCGALASRYSRSRMLERSTEPSGACRVEASSCSNNRRSQKPGGSLISCMSSGTPEKNPTSPNDRSWSFRRPTRIGGSPPKKSTRACSPAMSCSRDAPKNS